MDSYGLLQKFKLNRPLNNEEIAGKLNQNSRTDITNKELITNIIDVSVIFTPSILRYIGILTSPPPFIQKRWKNSEK